MVFMCRYSQFTERTSKIAKKKISSNIYSRSPEFLSDSDYKLDSFPPKIPFNIENDTEEMLINAVGISGSC